MDPRQQQLIGYLSELRSRAGTPSARSIARSMTDISHTTVNEVLKGTRTTSWESVRRIGEFLEADGDKLLTLWQESQAVATRSTLRVDSSFDPFVLHDVVVTTCFKDRVISQRTTDRLVSATEDGVDTYVVRAWQDSDSGFEIKAVLNCEIGGTRTLATGGSRSFQVTNVLLPEPLMKNQSCFFSSRQLTHSRGPNTNKADSCNFEVTGQRADRVELRLQFERDDQPSKLWYYRGGPEADRWIEPHDESQRIVQLSKLGFARYEFFDLESAVTVGLVWTWP